MGFQSNSLFSARGPELFQSLKLGTINSCWLPLSHSKIFVYSARVLFSGRGTDPSCHSITFQHERTLDLGHSWEWKDIQACDNCGVAYKDQLAYQTRHLHGCREEHGP